MSATSRKFRARIKFLPPEQVGARLEPAREGIRPQLKLNGIFTSVVVRSIAGSTIFEAGVFHEVELEVIFWNEYGHLLDVNAPVQLFEGSRLIAVGEILT